MGFFRWFFLGFLGGFFNANPAFKTPTKKLLLLHHFSKIKSHKEVTNSRNQGFSYYFCLIIRIRTQRIRIQEAHEHVDPIPNTGFMRKFIIKTQAIFHSLARVRNKST